VNEKVQRLRDAVLGRSGREVEVAPDGEVRERLVQPEPESEPATQPIKPTKLAARTFG
jgi:hypothetical protein